MSKGKIVAKYRFFYGIRTTPENQCFLQIRCIACVSAPARFSLNINIICEWNELFVEIWSMKGIFYIKRGYVPI